MPHIADDTIKAQVYRPRLTSGPIAKSLCGGRFVLPVAEVVSPPYHLRWGLGVSYRLRHGELGDAGLQARACFETGGDKRRATSPLMPIPQDEQCPVVHFADEVETGAKNVTRPGWRLYWTLGSLEPFVPNRHPIHPKQTGVLFYVRAVILVILLQLY